MGSSFAFAPGGDRPRVSLTVVKPFPLPLLSSRVGLMCSIRFRLWKWDPSEGDKFVCGPVHPYRWGRSGDIKGGGKEEGEGTGRGVLLLICWLVAFFVFVFWIVFH